ncbi:MAG: hypothetical protein EOR22_27095 [Mesorhizobium sp.]|nr:MAG: hypothetical protein EOR22_27095 [Mesorhizobium sp.]
MTGRKFSMISPELWRSARYHGLSDKAKVAHHYFLTNAHVTSPGCYILPDGYAASDLRWDLQTYQAMREEVQKAGLIDFDHEHSVIFIEKWLKHNAPKNQKHAIGMYKFINEIPSDRLRQKTLDVLAPIEKARVAKYGRDDAESEGRDAKTELDSRSAFGSDSHLTKTAFMRGQRR